MEYRDLGLPDLEAEAERYLEAKAESVGGARTHVGVGPPAEVILHASRLYEASLVVMSTHGRTGARRMLLGSVADAVLRAGETPLLLVRPKAVRHGGPSEEPAEAGS
jgi:nucleotide-binding universal stress UspA family protein